MGYGGSVLPRFVGMRRATEMLFTGEPIFAEQALAWGLINRVVPADQLDAEVARWAEGFSKAATIAMGAIKVNLTKGWHLSVEDGYDLVNAQMARLRAPKTPPRARERFARSEANLPAANEDSQQPR
jgi:enoyl-CoA hydratase/carnithine racemase